jgi:rfaE bifunctional protein nucleotidyltransferase chain/domain
MISEKVVLLDELEKRVQDFRRAGRKIVATNGCFDLLHVGHVRYLRAARKRGDALVVGINSDESIRKLKGPGRPVNGENDRAEIVAALEWVDLVTIFPQMRATRFLELTAPDVYVKGGDYNQDTLNAEEREVLQRIGAKIDLVAFEQGYSTSDLLARIQKLEK